MKRAILSAALLALALALAPASAQNNATLEKQDAEERYKRLNSALEELQMAQSALQKQLDAVRKEIGTDLDKLRADTARPAAGTATQADVQKLADALRKVDEQRAADKKLILDKMEEVVKLVKTLGDGARRPAPPVAKETHSANPSPDAHLPAKYIEYLVEENDTYSGIVKKYRANGIPVTLRQLQDANPGVDSARLKIGQKLIIPAP